MINALSQHTRSSRYASLLACVSACTALALACLCAPAQADVRSTDVISGGTVADRGFSTALCPNIEANHAILIDADGKVYFERGAHDGVQIASITKVMTAIVALDFDADLQTKVTVTEEAAAIGESSANLLEGDTLDLRNALTAMMVASGNDAAASVAYSIGAQMLMQDGHPGAPVDQCVQRFVDAMNEKALELGLENTVFTNPHGLDDGEYAGDLHSTASDVAKEVAYVMRNEVFRSIVGSETATVKVNRDGETIEIELASTDELLGLYEGTVGVKTGTTDAAGACFAGANVHDGGEYYAIVLDSSDEWQRFVDTQALWDWCYGHRVSYQLAHASQTVPTTINGVQAEYPLMAYVGHSDWLDRTVPATIADPQAAVDIFELDGNVSQELHPAEVRGNVKAGDVVGELVFKQRNEEIASVELVAAEDVAAPNPIEGIGIWWQRLWGNDQVAESQVVNSTPVVIDKTQTVASVNG